MPRATAASQTSVLWTGKGRGRWFCQCDVLGSEVVTFLCALSTTQRIETKRHRVCLEVPADVASKNNDEEEDDQYGKRPRLNLIPPRTAPQDVKRNKGIILFFLLSRTLKLPVLIVLS